MTQDSVTQASEEAMASARPWKIESTNHLGWKGLSIRAADGLYIANMVMQPGADNERANAQLIVETVNGSGSDD